MESQSNLAVARTSQASSAPEKTALEYNQESIQLIKDTFAKGATDTELALFIEIAKRKGLDIFSRQIFLVPRYDKKLQKYVKDPQTSIDGYRLIAERTGNYVPGREAQYGYTDKGELFCATSFVKKWSHGEWHEVAAVAFFEEYCQKDQYGKLFPMWVKYPHVMLAKCAEALALRKAFPHELSGIYTIEEMGTVEFVDRTPKGEMSIAGSEQKQLSAGDELTDPSEVQTGRVVATLSDGTEVLTDEHGEVIEESAPEAGEAENWDGVVQKTEPISQREKIRLGEICRKLEANGILEGEWRDEMKKMTGCTSRADLTAADAATVLAAFSARLNALLRERAK